MHTLISRNYRLPLRRITANLPTELLKEAQKLTHQGITETLVLGLEALVRISAAEKARALKGRLNLTLDAGRADERADR
ncbi:MAG: hypothetical protein EOP11_25050 [Proteobacteria bacterium]|nr:MAG: hypothetical protein EOP11_25050 [Pseudomonadota bacterium]